jgi:hypothetical protein
MKRRSGLLRQSCVRAQCFNFLHHTKNSSHLRGAAGESPRLNTRGGSCWKGSCDADKGECHNVRG